MAEWINRAESALGHLKILFYECEIRKFVVIIDSEPPSLTASATKQTFMFFVSLFICVFKINYIFLSLLHSYQLLNIISQNNWFFIFASKILSSAWRFLLEIAFSSHHQLIIEREVFVECFVIGNCIIYLFFSPTSDHRESHRNRLWLKKKTKLDARDVGGNCFAIAYGFQFGSKHALPLIEVCVIIFNLTYAFMFSLLLSARK